MSRIYRLASLLAFLVACCVTPPTSADLIFNQTQTGAQLAANPDVTFPTDQPTLDGDALAIAEIYSPELPVTLPTLRPNPFASSAEAEPSRYIDVAFDVTKYGAGERIQILETSKNATRAEKRDLIRVIETTTFRPRFADGNLAESAPVVVRYSLSPRGLRPRQ